MVKTLTAITAAVALTAAAVTVPTKAEATPAWVVPAIVAGSVGVLVGGTIVAANQAQAYPAGTIYVQPRAQATCHIVRERTATGWRRVEVCQ